MSNIKEFLASCGLEHYADLFELHEIDLEILPELGDDDLREIGLPLGPRKKIARGIVELAGLHAKDEPSTQASQAERRHLTVMFCDLADSTAIAEKLDPEEMSDLLREYQRMCTAAIDEMDGTIAKFMGDGVLAYFGYPIAHEDDPHRAVEAALSIAERAGNSAKVHGVQPVVRVGISTGVVVVGESIGDDSARERVAVGDTLNLAARLEGIAGPNGVVISESTRALLGSSFDFEPLGPHDLKGFSRPQDAFSVVGRRSSTRFDAATSSGVALVGRVSEMAVLDAAWERAVGGESARLQIVGDAGVGKSRLVDEFRSRAQALGTTVVQCSPQHINSPFWPIATWLREHVLASGVSASEALHHLGLDPITASCVAATIDLPGKDDLVEPPANPTVVRDQTIDGLASALCSSDGPKLVVVEDRQWVDPSTADVLEHVGETSSATLLIETSRRHETDRSADAEVLRLDRLNDAEARTLLVSLNPSIAAQKPTLERIVQRADGIPFFVEQLSMLVSSAQQDVDSRLLASVPDSLADALMARLDGLSRSRDYVLAASVVGLTFDVSLVAAAVGASSDIVAAALHEAVSALVIREVPGNEGRFAFTQTLMRDAAYESLVKQRRSGYHARVADAMTEGGSHEPEVIASHFVSSGRPELATEHWELAGHSAVDRSASVEAAAHFAEALRCLSESEGEAVDRELNLQLLLGARLLAINGFAALDVETTYSRAMELCGRSQKPTQQLAAYWGLWGFHVVRADLADAARLGGEFLSLADGLDHRVARVAARYALGVAQFYEGALETSMMTFNHALSLYDAVDRDDYLRLYGLDLKVSVAAYQGWVLALRGEEAEAVAAAEIAIEAGRVSGDPFSLAFATTFAAQTHLFLGRLDDAHLHASATTTMAFEHGYAQWQGQATIQLGRVADRRGDRSHLTTMQEGLDKYISTGAALALPYTRAWLAESNLDAGNDQEAELLLDQGLADTEATSERYYDAELLRLKAELSLRRGDNRRAKELLDDGEAIATLQGAELLRRRVVETRNQIST